MLTHHKTERRAGDEAVAILLPEEDQHEDDAARLVSVALLRRDIDAALAKGEQPLREKGGIPLENIKIEMRWRYG